MSVNINHNYYLLLLNHIKCDKKPFIDELNHKGYKLTGDESPKKIAKLILNLKNENK